MSDKIYSANGVNYSMKDILYLAFQPDFMTEAGMPRISDFHMKVGQPIRFRMDGSLECVQGGERLTNELMEQLLFPLMDEHLVQEYMKDGVTDVDTIYSLDETGYNFRINMFRDREGLASAIRMLPPYIPTLDEIGFPNEIAVNTILGLKSGLCLFTGVTGSGKSTTIASLLKHIADTKQLRIITLESPVEYIIPSSNSLISQREIGSNTAGYMEGLRSAMRENPDIIYVGEVRDEESAALMLSAAETGHLVFASLHAIDTPGGAARVVEMFPEHRGKEVARQISLVTELIVCQKLVPRKEGTGRVVAMEILRNTRAVANILRIGKFEQVYSAMEAGFGEGMITMDQHLIDLHMAGKISREMAVAYANHEDIELRI